MAQNITERKIYKIAEINAAARMLLEANFQDLWIEGEISNLAMPSSGHVYFSLKDETAQVRCAMFRNYNFTLNFKPKNGDHVVVKAKVSLYEARGDYQLIVESLELAGAGLLHEKFLRLKNKLETEGLFALTHKRPIPSLPHCIGVITSPTGAAIKDILTVLKRRFPSIPVIIYPTQVQGENAAAQIAEALRLAEKRSECDVLILARGGGSLEDLWPFNEEIVARAIFATTIPIISAVGHEIDFTIADFVADLRAPTPSAAAELAVPDVKEWLAKANLFAKRLAIAMEHKLESWRWNFLAIRNRLRHPRDYLLQQLQKADELERRLMQAMQLSLGSSQQKLSSYITALDLISPLAVLKRGFTIVTKDTKVLTSVNDVTVGDQIEVRLADGVLSCGVIKKII